MSDQTPEDHSPMRLQCSVPFTLVNSRSVNVQLFHAKHNAFLEEKLRTSSQYFTRIVIKEMGANSLRQRKTVNSYPNPDQVHF